MWLIFNLLRIFFGWFIEILNSVGALSEELVAKIASNSLQVTLVLIEKIKVVLEINEAKFEEGSHLLLKVFAELRSLHSVQVDLTRSHHHGLRNVEVGERNLVVLYDLKGILRNHLWANWIVLLHNDINGLRLNFNLGNGLRLNFHFDQVFRGGNWFHNKNVSPDFLAKSRLIVLQTEESGVATGLGRSDHLHGESGFLLRLHISSHLGKHGNYQFVSRGAHKLGVLRPGSLARVAVSPRAGKFLTNVNSQAITMGILHKAGHIAIFLRRFSHSRLHLLVRITKRHILIAHLLRASRLTQIVILAHDASRSLLGLSDLEHRVLLMNAFSLTVLANVIVVIDRAHVANAPNRSHFTAIANIGFVDFRVLSLLTRSHILVKDALEVALSLQVGVNLLANRIYNLLGEAGKETCAFTLFTSTTLFVEF